MSVSLPNPELEQHRLLCAFGQGCVTGRKGGYLADNPHPWQSESWQAWREGFAWAGAPTPALLDPREGGRNA